MANEIQLSITLQVAGHPGTITKTIQADQSTTGGGNPGLVAIGTTEEVISFGDVSSHGYVYIENLDDTNFITYGPTSGGSMITLGRLKAGEVCVFRMEPGISFRMKANTSSCRAFVALFEE